MTQQMSAARSFMRGRGFSSRSSAYGLGGHRTYAASVRYPVRSGYEVPAFTSQSLANMGGSRRISYGGYGGYNAGCYGGYNYGHGGGYGNLEFGGTMGHHVPRTYDSTGSCGPFGGYSNSRGDTIHGVRINEKLLKPLHVGVDPQDHEIRNHEREEMKDLNNQFAGFIEKVRTLEQENKALETKWNLLQQYAMVPKKNLAPYYENFISSIRNQIDCLLHDREHLASENSAIQHLVEEFKSKYEEEFKRRTTAENEFVLLKKDVDSISLSKTELEGKVDLLRRELEFRNGVYMEELTQLGGQISDMNILLQMDNSRDLDADLIIKNTEAWYQNIAQRSKEEVNALYGNRFQELQEQRAKYLNDLKINQHETEELTRVIHKLQSEHDSIKKQVGALQTSICEVEQLGDHAFKDAQEKHSDLQAALQKAKDDLAGMLKDYHDLLNVKVALDIEIATYKTLLEGEEIRLHTGNPFRIDVIRPHYMENSSGFAAPCGYGPLGRGYNSGYGGGYTTGGHRSYHRSSSTRSVGDYSRPEDSNNAATGHDSADAEFDPRGANSSRGVSYSTGKPNSPIGIDSSSVGEGVGAGIDYGPGPGFSSGSAQGSGSYVGRGRFSRGRAESFPDGGYPSGYYGPGYYGPGGAIPFGAGGLGPRVRGGPMVAGYNPGIARGVGMSNAGVSAVGIPVVRGLGLGRGPCVGLGAPVGVCHPGALGGPGGICYHEPVGAPAGICYPIGAPGGVCYPGAVAFL
ncbi:keratin, type II cytoskeletal 4-like [Sceloporus undulatus]|uniref:keratin, type II cytoskeletal 4-like n=1 Tax=Sceloporus undulatus TaxID=8520 RepID=UPI001C4A81A6|nr:keratin, type II cytoskeletal 4-like [Sceloporus undulatus]